MWQYLFTHTPLLYLVQSLWRDEAFSVLVAQESVRFILAKTSFEPPVYYLLLHIWVRLFGTSEIAVRSLSLLGFLLAVIVIIEWSWQVYKKHWLSVVTPVFFFLNPMLLYYAFEVRTYGWYTFFATATLYAYATKRWKWFIASAVLGFYTHVYIMFLFVALLAHWFITDMHAKKLSLRSLRASPLIRSFVIVGAFCLPWIIKIILLLPQLSSSWYFPVNIQLVMSVMGNIFLGYEGTPWYGWGYTAIASAMLLACGYAVIKTRKNRSLRLLFIFAAFIPVALVLGISFAKPIFVNRYLIPATVAEVWMVSLAVFSIKHSSMQKLAAGGVVVFLLWFNWWFPPQHPKTPIRDTFRQINLLAKDTDIILANHTLILLESKYYATNPDTVFLYNPDNSPFPWYVGDAVVSNEDMIADFPVYPRRAFLVNLDGSYEIVYKLAGAYKTP